MLAASGTETSLTSNYRSATSLYYAALSGLEEGRSRLLPQYPSPNSLNPTYIPAYGTLFPLGHAVYILNPLPSDTINLTAYGNLDQYPDTEWQKEFSGAPITQTVASVASYPGSPNALYKWVRINALTEQAIKIDVNNKNPGSGNFNSSKIIYFDGTNLTRNTASYQALSITALAGLPDGSRKMLQYVVGPVPLGLQFNAAVTLASPGISPTLANFNPPGIGPPYTFSVTGVDQSTSEGGKMGGGCAKEAAVPAFGVYNPSDVTAVMAGTSSNSPNHYTGTAPSNNVAQIGNAAPINWQDPVQLANLVKTIQGTADAVIAGPSATEADMPALMNSGNPLTVVVNGDLSLSGFTGYGILVVTGNLTYTGDSGWRGIILAIGNGVITETGSATGGEFDGAVFAANITGGVLGTSSWTVASPGGRGVFYDTCWISVVQQPVTYKVLSFREVPYP